MRYIHGENRYQQIMFPDYSSRPQTAPGGLLSDKAFCLTSNVFQMRASAQHPQSHPDNLLNENSPGAKKYQEDLIQRQLSNNYRTTIKQLSNNYQTTIKQLENTNHSCNPHEKEKTSILSLNREITESLYFPNCLIVV